MRDGAGRRATWRAGERVAHSPEGVDDVHGQLAYGAEPEVDGSAVQSGAGVAIRPGGLRRAGGGRSVGRAAGRPAERASERAGGRAKRAEGRAGERTDGRAGEHAGRQEGGRGRDERAGRRAGRQGGGEACQARRPGGRAGRHGRASRQTTCRRVSVRMSSQTRRVGSGWQGTCATAQGGGQHGARANVLLIL